MNLWAHLKDRNCTRYKDIGEIFLLFYLSSFLSLPIHPREWDWYPENSIYFYINTVFSCMNKLLWNPRPLNKIRVFRWFWKNGELSGKACEFPEMYCPTTHHSVPRHWCFNINQRTKIRRRFSLHLLLLLLTSLVFISGRYCFLFCT